MLILNVINDGCTNDLENPQAFNYEKMLFLAKYYSACGKANDDKCGELV